MKAGWKNDPVARALHDEKMAKQRARRAKNREDAAQQAALDHYAGELLKTAAKSNTPRTEH